jgi:archaellum component FlaC
MGSIETIEIDSDQKYLAGLTVEELASELDPVKHNNSHDYLIKIAQEVNNRILELKTLELRAQGEVTKLDMTYYG